MQHKTLQDVVVKEGYEDEDDDDDEDDDHVKTGDAQARLNGSIEGAIPSGKQNGKQVKCNHSQISTYEIARTIKGLLTNTILRTNSMSSLHNVDGELPETLGSIKNVTDSQEAVMSFYYTDAANQVQ